MLSLHEFAAAVGPDFDLEKPVVFTYEEILACTEGFSDSNVIGRGTYGSVYYGILREQVGDYLICLWSLYCSNFIRCPQRDNLPLFMMLIFS